MSLDQTSLSETHFDSLTKIFTRSTSKSEPIKGKFLKRRPLQTERHASWPTNHHNYQPQLRSLYEQRFSRRMSFAEYQRQIEIVDQR